jgi:hypothetical protein
MFVELHCCNKIVRDTVLNRASFADGYGSDYECCREWHCKAGGLFIYHFMFVTVVSRENM